MRTQMTPQYDASGVAAVSGAFTASGDTSATPFMAVAGRPMNLHLSNTWAGTVTLKRKLPGEAGYSAVTDSGTAVTFTANLNEAVWEESEAGAAYILDFVFTSGHLDYRLSQ